MLLDKIRETLRITHNQLDSEIQDMIDACKNDMRISGIVKIDEEDPLVLQAIKTYCKREYESDMNKRDRYDLAYNCIIKHMGLTKEYGEGVGDSDEFNEINERISTLEQDTYTVLDKTIDTMADTLKRAGVIDAKK